MKLTEMAVNKLVSSFEQHCLEQYKADLDFNMRRYNRAFDAMMAVSNELRSRPGDQRRALASLYDHSNEQVRLKAAIHTLALFPDDARAVMQKLIGDRIYPQAGDAGMLLDSLDEGRYVPE
ncbi:DUF2019 domain-containing protein [Mesorhizobium koreense]|jgi:hypothetical protein|uniref:DUF2019 domain-containing protein n=1 Tax=Mesorhizobium koreense TaxID=3074855 RepID=UPI00287B5C8A|nr:DUF2019 domain-containing protein [Mesorhizobium sp. WR6]